MKLRLLLLLLSLQLSLQEAWTQEGEQYVVRYLNEKFSFSEKRILSVVRDAYGYVWFATPNGINRFDGQDVKIYRMGAHANSISSNNILTLNIDGDFLWIGHENGFIDKMNVLSGHIDRLGKFSDKEISRIYNDSSGTWITTINTLIHRNKETADTFHIKLDYIPPHDSSKVEYARDNYINGIYDDQKGSIWLATFNGLFQYETSTRAIMYHAMPRENPFWRDDVFHDVVADVKGNLWLGTWGGGLVTFNINAKSWNVFKSDQLNPYASTSNIIVDVEWKNKNELWLATLRDGLGIFNIETHKFSFPWTAGKEKVDEHKPSTFITRLNCDYEQDILWCGGEYGVYSIHYDNYVFKRYHLPVTKSDNGPFFEVRDVVEDKSRNITLVATAFADGLNIIDNASGTVVHYNVPVDDEKEKYEVISDLFLEGTDSLWVTTRDQILLFNLDERKWLPFPQPPRVRKYNSPLFKKILKDIQGNYWFTFEYGLYKYEKNNNAFVLFTSQDDASSGRLRSDLTYDMCQDKRGNIWVTNRENGFNIYVQKSNAFLDDTVINSFIEKYNIKNVYGIVNDNYGNIWMASSAGVVKFALVDEDRYVPSVFLDNELLSIPASDIEKDSSGKIWVISSGGLYMFDPFNPHAAKVYNEFEGFDYPSFVALKLSVNGERLYVNVYGGWFVVNTSNLWVDIRNKYVHIDEFKVFDKTVPLMLNGNGLQANLSFKENFFTFEYSTVSYNNPSNLKFAYKLEGFDQDWITVKRRSAYYTNVPPGEYVFKIRTTNDNGLWSPRETAVVVSITPPFWKTATFKIFVPAILACVVLVMFRFRENYLVSERLRLEKLVEQRTKQINNQKREIQIKNEEIVSQNEELSSQAEILVTQNDTLRKQHEELESIKSSLEEMVKDRTKKLEQLNEELMDQNVKLEQFTFITAHNLRSPIAQLKGLIMLTESGTKGLSYQEALPLIKQSAFWLDEVITDLNHILHIRKNSANTEVVDLKEQLTIALHSLEFDINKAEARIDYSDMQNAFVHGVRAYVQSIFYNLVHNAIKYSKKNSKPEVKISSVVKDGEVVIKVSDNGIGIDMRYAKEKIFRLYQRFSTNYQGKGYGLFLVKTQVESMRGKIEVESEVYVGTTFTITLPVTETTPRPNDAA